MSRDFSIEFYPLLWLAGQGLLCHKHLGSGTPRELWHWRTIIATASLRQGT